MGIGSKVHDRPHGSDISVAFLDANRGGDLGFHRQVSCQAWGTGLGSLLKSGRPGCGQSRLPRLAGQLGKLFSSSTLG